MKKLAAWAVVAAGTVAFAGVGVVACSSGSSSGHPGTDASADGTSGEGAANDGTTNDVVTAEGGKDSASEGSTNEGGSTCQAYDASALSEASVTAGFDEVWQVYKCYGCHQKKSQIVDDAGNGIVLSGNNDGLGDSGTTYPPNLTPDPTTGVGCWTDQQLSDAILNGKDNEGGVLCPSMPRWGNAILTADGGDKPGTPMDAGTAQEIIDYLRSLPAVVNAVPDTTCGDGGTSGTDAGDAAAD
jgi:hypothetical protein